MLLSNSEKPSFIILTILLIYFSATAESKACTRVGELIQDVETSATSWIELGNQRISPGKEIIWKDGLYVDIHADIVAKGTCRFYALCDGVLYHQGDVARGG